ncbi:hypothetical protein A9HBioS_4754 [Pseudomonas koreensis]|uniref:Uncharacterized protein n=1 Tax=Pseudomonas koreensis TaxID=198620 RepID=A0AA94EJG5_9PSED|nr:hypothetical protein A9HBioS_4754 [Pseudomonas koreensis]
MSYLIDAPEFVSFVSFGGDSAIRVIGESASGAAGQGDLGQAISGVPLILSNRTEFVLSGDLPTQHIGTILELVSIGQALLPLLAEVVLTELIAVAYVR